SIHLKYTFRSDDELQAFVRGELAKYETQPVATPQKAKPVAVVPSQCEAPEAEAKEEEWVSTLEYQLSDRKQIVFDYLITRPKGQTRYQIETGAGYRREEDFMPKEEYKKFKRRVQRDLELMLDDGSITRDTRPNPRHQKGHNDDIVLYFANV